LGLCCQFGCSHCPLNSFIFVSLWAVHPPTATGLAQNLCPIEDIILIQLKLQCCIIPCHHMRVFTLQAPGNGRSHRIAFHRAYTFSQKVKPQPSMTTGNNFAEGQIPTFGNISKVLKCKCYWWLNHGCWWLVHGFCVTELISWWGPCPKRWPESKVAKPPCVCWWTG